MISRLTQVKVDRGDGEKTQLTDEWAGFTALLGGAGAEDGHQASRQRRRCLFHRNPDQYRQVMDEQRNPGGGRGDPSLLRPPSTRAAFFLPEERDPQPAARSRLGSRAVGHRLLPRDERFFDDADTFHGAPPEPGPRVRLRDP